MGTTHLGYDLYSQLILATRTTLLIGVVSGFISIVIGANIGLIAGYYGGKIDEVLMRLTDILYGMPFLPFIIVLIALFGRQLEFIILAIVLIIWRTSARVIRAQAMSIKQRQFIQMAKARGASDFRIIYHAHPAERAAASLALRRLQHRLVDHHRGFGEFPWLRRWRDDLMGRDALRALAVGQNARRLVVVRLALDLHHPAGNLAGLCQPRL